MWVQSADVLWRTAPDYLALCKVDGEPVEVHGPGAIIWAHLTSPIPESDLVDSVAMQYGVDASEIAHDVHQLLTDLEVDGYVRRGE